MTLRIATLGATRNFIPNQSRFWDFPWEHVDADEATPDGQPHEVDVLLAMTYNLRRFIAGEPLENLVRRPAA